MRKHKKQIEQEGFLDLIERAVHLLRRAPLSTLALYYLGVIPFVLTLLFFLADMASSPFAQERCIHSALGLALLYLWMRLWQSVYCQQLKAQLTQTPPPSLNGRFLFRQCQLHLLYSAWGMVLLPLAAMMTIPLIWAVAYFNNLCIVNVKQQAPAEAAEKARAMTRPWPRQNYFTLSVLGLFNLFILLNLITVLSQTPMLLKSLLGIETPFSQSYYWMGSTTFLSAVCALTYMLADPLLKAVYVIRFQAAESIQTGDDLLTEIRNLPRKKKRSGVQAALLLIAGGLLVAIPAPAQENSAPPPTVEQSELNASIEEVMKRPEFTWRMPREYVPIPDEEKNVIHRFFDSLFKSIENGFRAIGDKLEAFFDWLYEKMNGKQRDRDPRDHSFDPSIFKGLSIGLLVVLIAVLAWQLFKAVRLRRKPLEKLQEAQPAFVTVDLEDENLVATLLEEDEWIQLARKLAASGEHRKAMRAWFLASLALLSRCDLLTILQSKSNCDYRNELHRRARRCPAIIPTFASNIQLFEQGWYGLHAVTPEELTQLEQNMERMRHDVEA